MNEKNCETCIHAKPFGGSNDNRCGAWECEYINRKEAIEVMRKYKAYEKVKAVTIETKIGE